ncbi:hypothetical protein [Halarcobacter ebronensis]|uniref:Uncharacterized protein n=1 Tax=Halarcobacter ebronensis TaxID=1462615 RepID=A0A4Q1AUY5_9BACT|nr:hypothetical protein [Halarcobacter ebronensis]QKF80722.1 hypothetical protein AEBR_0206 [Halarcobacter ebronensis]RXK08515.1 hypothetical protein CRV07_01575 [Halarcobacter ebronensis]
MEKVILDLFKYSRGTYYTWKREKRPIIKLIEKYFTESYLQEFLETGNIAVFELLDFAENKLSKNLFKFIESILSLSDSNIKYFYEFLVEHLKDKDLFSFDDNKKVFIWRGTYDNVQFKKLFYEFIKNKEINGEDLFLFSEIINKLTNEDIKYLQLNLKNTFYPLFNHLNSKEFLNPGDYNHDNKCLEKTKQFIINFCSHLDNNGIKKDIHLNDLIKKSINSITEMQKKVIKELEERQNAILDCYGIKAINENKSIKLSNGEIISAWVLNEVPDLESLMSFNTINEITYIYNA